MSHLIVSPVSDTPTDVSVVSLAGNTKKSRVRSRIYCFTLNNPEENGFTNLSHLSHIFDALGAKSYIYQLEEGDEKKTPHLQGVVQFQNQLEFSTVKQIHNAIHWEVCKNFKASINYCSKAIGRIEGPWYKGLDIAVPRPIKLITEFRPFQQRIINLINNPTTKEDDRTIYWFWDKNGNIGKTQLAKYICLNYNALYLSGKSNDIKCAVAKHIETKKELDIAIFYYTRTVEDYVSYEALESIKDGIFFSGKYESQQVIFNSPILICFSNFPPNENSLSKDRWHIEEITDI